MTTNQETTQTPTRSRRTLWWTVGGVIAAGSLLSAGVQLAVDDSRDDDPAPVTQRVDAASVPAPDDAVQQGLDALVADAGYPAALASVRDADGTTRDHAAGVADLGSGDPAPLDGYVRIGSNTKTYTAVVVLQLVDEGVLDLDEPIETYLPGVVRGDGIDATAITVRDLLQHTSGLGEYLLGFLGEDPGAHLSFQHTSVTPDELLATGLAQPVSFPAGEGWSYSNTNYLLAGLIVEKVTGETIEDQVRERIIEPLGLTETVFPLGDDESIPEEHPHGYHPSGDGTGPLVDVTGWNPTMAWAAGAMVATPSDINTFFVALLDGELLEPATLEEMRTTTPADELGDGVEYGLGLVKMPLSCGGSAWGHGGDIFGYHTTNATTDDGRAVSVAVTMLPSTMEQIENVAVVVDEALCLTPSGD